MAATIRGTPNYTAPSSQNTAPVDEFRCLYTHDLRKKAKKWHDGSLKFHTFNQRVMVYDDCKNFIGDLHYRSGDFGEGTEIQLDRGVLVEVGEPLGQTQTDLTALLDRGRADKDISSSGAAHAVTACSVRRANPADSQNRPKSLAEVLGASQGRLGRARLPNTSPYEYRQASEKVRHVEPPSKKRRISPGVDTTRVDSMTPARRSAPGKENIPLPRDDASNKDDASIAVMQKLPAPSQRSIDRNVHAQRQSPVLGSSAVRQEVVDLSTSEEEVAPQAKPHTSRIQKINDSTAAKKFDRVLEREKTIVVEPSRPKEINKPETTSSARTKRLASPPQQQSAHTTPTSSNVSGTSRVNCRPGMSFLRFASTDKARPKLMYKALLPSSTAESRLEHRSKSRSQETSQPVSVATASTHLVKPRDPTSGYANEADAVFDIDMDEASTDLPPVENGSSRGTEPKADQRQRSVDVDDSNPLFLTQEEPADPSHLHRVLEEEDIDLVSSQEPGGRLASRNLQVRNGDGVEVEIEIGAVPDATLQLAVDSPSQMAPTKSLPLSGPQSPQVSINTAQNPISPANKEKTIHQSHGANRPFRRILSEGDSPFSQDPKAVSSTRLSPIDESPLRSEALPQPIINIRNPSFHRSPKTASLQRSTSDTAAIVPQPERIETIDINDPVVTQTEEQGPWTKVEAFLLFDTWPECKRSKQPVFERRTDATLDSDDDNHGPGLKSAGLGRGMASAFRSARCVLRDEE